MEKLEAKILLRNLVRRIKSVDDGGYRLSGDLTDDELAALNLALQALEGGSSPNSPTPAVKTAGGIPPIPEYTGRTSENVGTEAKPEEDESDVMAQPERPVELDTSVLALPQPPNDTRLCIDFGTAMSKATLVHDADEGEVEEIHVLKLGIPGDQEELSELMLISSVYIDNEGLLWFGKMAVERSMHESQDGSRKRIDNIKRRLSEDGWDEAVSGGYNPTDIKITYGDMVIAYLMFLTWAINHGLEAIEAETGLMLPRNLRRRFAMPCLNGQKTREAEHKLRHALGEAQILADTFFTSLKQGVPLKSFMDALSAIRVDSHSYPFVAEAITEPLGVAGSMVSWRSPVDMLAMVIDVGAGTSDFSLYRIHINPAGDTAYEIEGTARGITEAGNYLDRILIEYILNKAGVTSKDPLWINIRSALELNIRDYKETLFNDDFVFVTLIDGREIEIEREEFESLPAVIKFGDSLKSAMQDILMNIDESWINWILKNPQRRLVIALTGGGAELPMVRRLAEGSIKVGSYTVPLARAKEFPDWLRDVDENLEADYSRVAVSLGGARKRLINIGGSAKITAGDSIGTPRLGGYYTKGN